MAKNKDLAEGSLDHAEDDSLMPDVVQTIGGISRLRPFQIESPLKYLPDGLQVCVQDESNSNCITLLTPAGATGDRLTVPFEKVFDGKPNEFVFNEAVYPKIVSCISEGKDLLIPLMGSSGSGKTYTFNGTDADPGFLYQLGKALQFGQNETVLVSAYEAAFALKECQGIFRDLSTKHELDGSPSETLVTEFEDFWRVAQSLNNSRTSAAATDANSGSTRGHLVFQVCVKKHGGGSRIVLIDFCGEEAYEMERDRTTRLQGIWLTHSLAFFKEFLRAVSSGCSPDTIVPLVKQSAFLSSLPSIETGEIFVVIHFSPFGKHFEGSLSSMRLCDVIFKYKVETDLIKNNADALVILVQKLQKENRSAEDRFKLREKIIAEENRLFSKKAQTAVDELEISNNKIDHLTKLNATAEANIGNLNATIADLKSQLDGKDTKFAEVATSLESVLAKLKE